MSNPTNASSLTMARPTVLGRSLALAYGIFSYATFLGVFSAFALWVGGLLVPFFVDRGVGLVTVSTGWGMVLLNLALVAGFGVQHSIMARKGFKRWLTRIIPAGLERSTFMLAASVMMLAIIVFWQPLTATIWNVTHPVGAAVLWSLFAIGWLGVVATTFMINHFELFGLMQVWAHATGQPFRPLPFRTPSMYRWVRHPMMFFVVIGFWAIPHLTMGHALLALGFTLYVVVGIWFEERDLVRNFGSDYRRYQDTTSQLVPRLFGNKGGRS